MLTQNSSSANSNNEMGFFFSPIILSRRKTFKIWGKRHPCIGSLFGEQFVNNYKTLNPTYSSLWAWRRDPEQGLGARLPGLLPDTLAVGTAAGAQASRCPISSPVRDRVELQWELDVWATDSLRTRCSPQHRWQGQHMENNLSAHY